MATRTASFPTFGANWLGRWSYIMQVRHSCQLGFVLRIIMQPATVSSFFDRALTQPLARHLAHIQALPTCGRHSLWWKA